jgi:branched-chain amino acid transport system substrate-binding protein
MCRKLLFPVVAALGLVFSQGVWSQNIKIAVLGPMAFIQGEYHWAGAEMARDEINKAGGISVGGKKRLIEIIKIDTNEIQSVPDATNAIERAITRDKADFLIGGFRSEAVLAMQEVAMDAKKLFLGVGAADAKLTENVTKDYERYKYWFRVTPTKSADLVKTVFTVLGAVGGQIRADLKKEVPKVAILAEKAAWTEAIVKAAEANLPKMKMEVVGTWQPSPIATDVTAELSAIKRSGADIVFTVISGPMGIVLGRQMGELQLPAIAFGINVEAQKDGFWQATAGKGNYLATLNTFAEVEVTPKMIPFLKAFRERYKKTPTYTAATYDAIHILQTAIEQTGTLDANKLIPVIEKMEAVGAAGIDTWDKSHDLIWGVGKTSGVAVQWQDGQLIPFWPPQIKGMKPFKMPKY